MRKYGRWHNSFHISIFPTHPAANAFAFRTNSPKQHNSAQNWKLAHSSSVGTLTYIPRLTTKKITKVQLSLSFPRFFPNRISFFEFFFSSKIHCCATQQAKIRILNKTTVQTKPSCGQQSQILHGANSWFACQHFSPTPRSLVFRNVNSSY